MSAFVAGVTSIGWLGGGRLRSRRGSRTGSAQKPEPVVLPPRWGVVLQVLYFDGCPGHQRLLPCLSDLAVRHGAALQQWRIETVEQAEQAGFLGSPSVRVNGVDVEPGVAARTDYGLKCRLYRCSDGQSGVPPREWIERALREAAG